MCPPLTSILPEAQVNHGLADTTAAYGLTDAAGLAGTMHVQLPDTTETTVFKKEFTDGHSRARPSGSMA